MAQLLTPFRVPRPQDSPAPGAPPLAAGASLPPDTFAALRRRMVLDCCKWDPQVGDVGTLAPFPLVLRADAWRRLAQWAECLAREATDAEAELLRTPHLLERLGLPRPIRNLLRNHDRSSRSPGPSVPALTPPAARVIRFDFHWTAGNPSADGWHISEANSDVPGGFTEASSFPALMADHFAGLRPAGDPAARWADAVCDLVGGADGSDRPGGRRGAVAMLCAAGYMEDQQVVAYLARHLRACGLTAVLADPRQLRWDGGVARMETVGTGLGGAVTPHDKQRLAPAPGAQFMPLAAIVRFYQGEWLVDLPRRCGWRRLFVGGCTPVVNPGVALLTESKRFPLTWDAGRGRRFGLGGGGRAPGLLTPLPTWRLLLPEARDPRDAPWRTDDGWVLKPAFGNTGDHVSARAWSDEHDGAGAPDRHEPDSPVYSGRRARSARDARWRAASWAARWSPGWWVAQRRFEALPIPTPAGAMYPCVGVFTVNGRAAGIYGRMSPRPLIDYAATDVAVLVEAERKGSER